jgi:hypothetical protein
MHPKEPAKVKKYQYIFFPGLFPGGNELFGAAVKHRGTDNAYNQLKRKYEADLHRQIKRARLCPVGRVIVSFEWIERNRKRDPDNIAAFKKVLLDALVRSGVLAEGDGWRGIAGLRDSFRVNDINPKEVGVLVTIQEVDHE